VAGSKGAVGSRGCGAPPASPTVKWNGPAARGSSRGGEQTEGGRRGGGSGGAGGGKENGRLAGGQRGVEEEAEGRPHGFGVPRSPGGVGREGRPLVREKARGQEGSRSDEGAGKQGARGKVGGGSRGWSGRREAP